MRDRRIRSRPTPGCSIGCWPVTDCEISKDNGSSKNCELCPGGRAFSRPAWRTREVFFAGRYGNSKAERIILTDSAPSLPDSQQYRNRVSCDELRVGGLICAWQYLFARRSYIRSARVPFCTCVMPAIRMNSLKSRATNCGPLSEMIDS